jgi:predicted GNAT family N-acyltransferase
MAVAAAHQKKGIGTSIIKECIARSKAKHLQSVRLAARCTAVEFYRTFDFKISGEIYPSQKTGIPHQNMILQLFTNNNIE